MAPSKPSSSRTKRPPAPRKMRKKKGLSFGPVEVIGEESQGGMMMMKKKDNHGTSGGKLKRSPTPVLTSLTELTNAHLDQLQKVWKEKWVPGFEEDRKEIMESRKERKRDPFDF